ncbi:hypothetical protein M501DRAFT_1032893 [Patellaria atrata CBS 101060]|uniref:Peptidase A1 domain-containing protein n=1 Tax=Patellaria atrata CBS 101060 TaxID=1346257 RepID=A0A9P4S7T5_9PEZI|nr:hypothetical protein M501DRAFT_1032893 [Patellaria atrata CBS 101060]
MSSEDCSKVLLIPIVNTIAHLGSRLSYSPVQTNCIDQDISLAKCIWLHGGLFFPNASISFQPSTNDVDQAEESMKGTDTLGSFGVQGGINDFPISIIKEPTFTMGPALGIGPSSTILKTLLNRGLIVSNTWGYRAGLDTTSNITTIFGDLILGGYDSTVFLSSSGSIDFPLQVNSKCPSGMIVPLSGLTIDLIDGTEPSLLDGHALQACLCIHCKFLIEVPRGPYLQRFEELIGAISIGDSHGYYEGTALFPTNNTYLGGFKIEISNELILQIPHHLVVGPERILEDKGTFSLNKNVSNVLIKESKSESKMVVLGELFFSSVYLLVDYDRRIFSLISFSDHNSPLIPVAILRREDGIDECRELLGTSSSTEGDMLVTATSMSTSPSSATNTSSSGLNKTKVQTMPLGVRMSIGFGLTLAFVLIGLTILAWRKRRSRNIESGKDPIPGLIPTQELYGEVTPEVQGDIHLTQEMVGSGDLILEMADRGALAPELAERQTPIQERHASSSTSATQHELAGKLNIVYELPPGGRS